MRTIRPGESTSGPELKQRAVPRDPAPQEARPRGTACDVCGYCPQGRIPDRCPVCLSHRDHFRPVP
ncbi:MAG: hypothetical protein R6V58_01670 [Planctomycetota bacterium]